MKEVVLYTDGACSGNPGPGGWGAILVYKGKEKVMSGGMKETTNNHMEILAVIEGLKCLKEPCKVEIYSDSAYVVNTFLQGWLENWIKNDWKTSSNKQVQNVDLWKELIALLNKHEVHWNKVKGHADNELNNRCDALARGEIDKIKKALTK